MNLLNFTVGMIAVVNAQTCKDLMCEKLPRADGTGTYHCGARHVFDTNDYSNSVEKSRCLENEKACREWLGQMDGQAMEKKLNAVGDVKYGVVHECGAKEKAALAQTCASLKCEAMSPS